MGALCIDFGRKRPTSERVDLLTPLPIFLNMMEAEDAVEETDMLSVDAEKTLPCPE